LNAPSISQSTVVRQFRERREPEWQRLERILELAEGKSVRSLGDEDLLALPILYRGALSSLSLARETSLDLELVTYLEGLCARAYFFVYGVRSTPGSKLAMFFRHDWPEAVRSIWRESLLALVIMTIGVAAGFILVMNEPAWYGSFIPEGYAQGRDFSASDQDLRDMLYHDQGASGLAVFASFLFTNNSGVALLAFALGFAFGVPTAMLLVHNMTLLGAMFALYGSRGMAFELGGWLSIHGTTELFAILLAGAGRVPDRMERDLPGRRTAPDRCDKGRQDIGQGDGRGGDHADGRRFPGRVWPAADPGRSPALRRRFRHAGAVARLFLPAARPRPWLAARSSAPTCPAVGGAW
jgi:uncharacterized membrane protein SpoIIM required for sporulation